MTHSPCHSLAAPSLGSCHTLGDATSSKDIIHGEPLLKPSFPGARLGGSVGWVSEGGQLMQSWDPGGFGFQP